MIEVKHEGGIVYVDGYGITVEEADNLSLSLRRAADEAKRWRYYEEVARRRMMVVAQLEAGGLTHVESRSENHRSYYIARRNGLPVVMGDAERSAWFLAEVGDGPPLEARVCCGRKWRPLAELKSHQQVAEWRLVTT